MTLAGGDTTWSARHWDTGTGAGMDCTHATNVIVIGDRLAVSWNDALSPPQVDEGLTAAYVTPSIHRARFSACFRKCMYCLPSTSFPLL